MAVQRRVNWLSGQRVDVPDMRSVESAASNDFDQLIQAFVTGTTQGYFVRGFNILMAGAIGGAANGLQLNVDPGAILHIAASQSGTILMVPTGTAAQPLNASTNTNVTGAFSPSAVNYVTIDYLRFIDPNTSAQVYIWNPTTNNETTLNAPRAQILEYTINISTTTPTPNLLPVATVITDANNNVVSIEDDRNLIGRLGKGGINPNPFNTYSWPQGRVENPSTSTSNTSDPFYGGDKSISSLKDWMDAVMSSIQEIKGTNFWYSASQSGSLETLREDLGNTIITGSGNISQGIIPNSDPILVTTGTISPSSNQLTALASVAGLSNGDYIFATGIPTGTTILGISGTTITMSQSATLTGAGITVTFYSPAVVTSPGQINWDQPIQIRVIGSELTYTIAANLNSTDITLADDQVAYITLVRGVSIAPSLIYTNGVKQVVSVGGVSWTASLQAGDFIKVASQTDSFYYQIQSVDSLTQVTLTTNYAGTTSTASGDLSVYAFGSYSASPTPSTNRNIYISSRETVPSGGDVFWLFARNDNGGAARVYVRFLGAELDNGEDRAVGGTTPDALVRYIGAGTDTNSSPEYASALNPSSVTQIQTLTVGAASTMASNEYFYIWSPSNYRQYYVWVNKDGTGVDPTPLFAAVGIQWPISTGQTATQVASALAVALSETYFEDFQATASTSTVVVTNSSAGACNTATNVSIGAPFAITLTQAGTGAGNYGVQDGQNLTLGIKNLDTVIGTITAIQPGYDEIVTVVASGATPPQSITGPISSGTNIQLPPNSRNSSIQIYYQVGSGKLEIYLNGQKLTVGVDYTEVGSSGAPSDYIQIQQNLVVGDELEFILENGASGSGGGKTGPAGPTGPTGPAGMDAAGGPVSISVKTSNYTVLSTDCFLAADCTTAGFTFTLPAASSVTGKIFYFKKIDATTNTMTIAAAGSDLIDGASTIVDNTQYFAYSLISNGTGWYTF